MSKQTTVDAKALDPKALQFAVRASNRALHTDSSVKEVVAAAVRAYLSAAGERPTLTALSEQPAPDHAELVARLVTAKDVLVAHGFPRVSEAVSEAIAALSRVQEPVAVPVGWYLVPEVPTESQMQAGLYQSSHDATYEDVCQSYMDMVRTPLDAPALATPPAPQGDAATVHANDVSEAMEGGKGFWRSCSGCHELNDGAPTGPYSKVFRCSLGVGCFECGGIGAVWDTTDYADMGNYLAQQGDAAQPAADGWRAMETCPTADNLVVLGWGEYRERDGFSPAFMRYYKSIGGWSVNAMPFYPTHWMPLPASPAASQGGAEK